jgi:hypothetical protein
MHWRSACAGNCAWKCMTRAGTPWSDLLEIRSEVPVRVSVMLGVATVTTLVDPYSTDTRYSIGGQAIEEHDAAQPGASCWIWCPNSPDGSMKQTACFIRAVRNTTCNL